MVGVGVEVEAGDELCVEVTEDDTKTGGNEGVGSDGDAELEGASILGEATSLEGVTDELESTDDEGIDIGVGVGVEVGTDVGVGVGV